MAKDEIINNTEEEILEFDDEYDRVILEDENSNKIEFLLLDEVPYKGKTYSVLLPADDEECEDVTILEVKAGDKPDEAFYLTVDSQEEIDAVFEEFKRRNPEEFNYVD